MRTLVYPKRGVDFYASRGLSCQRRKHLGTMKDKHSFYVLFGHYSRKSSQSFGDPENYGASSLLQE